MAGQPKATKAIGLIVGLVIMAGAIYSVVFVDWKTEIPPEPPVVRPLKTMVIESPFAATGRRYPGKVQANEEVNLAFQVPGQLVEFPVRKGLEVTEGDLLGRLDARDYENALATAQARLDADQNDYERLKGLAERDMASSKEVIDAKAAYDIALADVDSKTKALDDTKLLAPFSGVIANTLVDNFQNVSAQQPVLSLQEVERVEIEVNVPEERVVRGKQPGSRFVATFEYLPDREFEVDIKEFATEADPATQTYAATFVMPTPEDVTILPGMTATVREFFTTPEAGQETAYAVPIDAVPVDGQGNYFVWVVQGVADGTATVQRVRVQVGEMIGSDILVREGLEPGQRIALAGVHLLQEGQQVRPFAAKGDATP